MSFSRNVVRGSAGRTFVRATGSSFNASASSSSAAARAIYARQFTSSSRNGSSSSSSSSSSKTKATPYALGLLGGLGGYFGLSSDKDAKTTQEGTLKKGSEVDYQQVYNAVADILEAEDYDDGSFGPILVRLAWHCSGTYDKNTGNGGSNGATMRFAPEADHGANAGLKVARDLLEPIKKKFPGLSYSDLWTLAGVCAIQEMQGPKIGWRAGRQDGMAENCTPDGRLPDGDKGADHLRYIFYKMGFNDQEIVALSGAHALGRCHTDRSGFEGPWTFSPTTFTHDYYKLLFNEKWHQRKWDGPIQLQDKSTKSLMMLMTDWSLTTDKNFRKYAQKYAEDEQAFFDDFSAAFSKLLELGVPEKQWKGEKMYFKTIEEQQDEAKK